MLDADVVVDIVLTVVVDWCTHCYTIVVNVDVVNHIAVGVDAATIEEKVLFCPINLMIVLRRCVLTGLQRQETTRHQTQIIYHLKEIKIILDPASHHGRCELCNSPIPGSHRGHLYLLRSQWKWVRENIVCCVDKNSCLFGWNETLVCVLKSLVATDTWPQVRFRLWPGEREAAEFWVSRT